MRLPIEHPAILLCNLLSRQPRHDLDLSQQPQPGLTAHSLTASSRRPNRSRNSAVDSIVSQSSPVPTSAPARHFFPSIISSILSFTLPAQRHLCTYPCTDCPIRKTRYVS